MSPAPILHYTDATHLKTLHQIELENDHYQLNAIPGLSPAPAPAAGAFSCCTPQQPTLDVRSIGLCGNLAVTRIGHDL